MLNHKTSLGIDISDGLIKIVKLASDKKGIKLLKTAECSIPIGAIKNGNIEDPAGLAKTIKELVITNKMRASHVAVSTTAQPMLVQIMDLPKEHSVNVSQFIRDEVKNYAILPMNNVLIDFCGLTSSGKNCSRRAMVVAMAGEKTANFAETLCRFGLNVDSIEPALAAYIRACYAKKIVKIFDRNLLFTLIRDDELTFCIFKNQVLEFIQTKQIEKQIMESDQCCKWLAQEINAVIGYYENEYPDDRDPWEVTLISSIFKGPDDANANALGVYIDGVTINIVTSDQAWIDTPVTEKCSASAVAIGLAMKHLNCQTNNNFCINLLPETTNKVKAVKKQMFVALNIAAVIFFLLVVSFGFLCTTEKKIKDKLKFGKQQPLEQNAQSLLSEQLVLNTKIANVSKKLEEINRVMTGERFLKWADILQSISNTVPQTVRITELSGNSNNDITIQGVAFSYASINLFVDQLNNCKHIAHAIATETSKDKQADGMVNYSIKCSLTEVKG